MDAREAGCYRASTMRSSRALLATAVVTLSLLEVAPARAQAEAVSAELFERGLASMQAGDFEQGCGALKESFRLDPRPGTLFTLAECEKGWGKLARAMTHYEDYLARYARMPEPQRATQRERFDVATAAVEQLKGEVPRLLVRVEGSLPPGAAVTCDELPLGSASLGVALPFDPGAHVVRLTGAGAPQEQRVDLVRGATKVVVLYVSTGAAAASGEGEGAADGDVAGPPRGRRTLVYAVGGVGAASLATGLVLGAIVLGKKGTVDDHCVDGVCDAEGKSAADSAQALGLWSTVTTGVGVAGIAAAAVLFFTDPARKAKESARAPALRLEPRLSLDRAAGWAGVGGTF